MSLFAATPRADGFAVRAGASKPPEAVRAAAVEVAPAGLSDR
jgi:hypothetical protein